MNQFELINPLVSVANANSGKDIKVQAEDGTIHEIGNVVFDEAQDLVLIQLGTREPQAEPRVNTPEDRRARRGDGTIVEEPTP